MTWRGEASSAAWQVEIIRNRKENGLAIRSSNPKVVCECVFAAIYKEVLLADLYDRAIPTQTQVCRQLEALTRRTEEYASKKRDAWFICFRLFLFSSAGPSLFRWRRLRGRRRRPRRSV